MFSVVWFALHKRCGIMHGCSCQMYDITFADILPHIVKMTSFALGFLEMMLHTLLSLSAPIKGALPPHAQIE